MDRQTDGHAYIDSGGDPDQDYIIFLNQNYNTSCKDIKKKDCSFVLKKKGTSIFFQKASSLIYLKTHKILKLFF